jgi:hypothetical protein
MYMLPYPVVLPPQVGAAEGVPVEEVTDTTKLLGVGAVVVPVTSNAIAKRPYVPVEPAEPASK